MRVLSARKFSAALLLLAPAGLALNIGIARADDTTKPANASADDPGVGLLDAARAGDVDVQATGNGDGKMTIKVTNRTKRKLKVVLPPGLVASGATGQFGGGGMGGGMGGGGMGGGGMGGMGGGGMGGGGMGGGGMGGGGMGGGGMAGGGRQLTMPATMGMMMLGRLIMQLVEPTESWNPASLMSGMMGMGGGGMGGMGGGGMGGMGGGGMGGGGMGGGGFRSVPPTQPSHATLAPGQTRDLATGILSLNAPGPDGSIAYPQPGEPLQLGDAATLPGDARMQAALVRLAKDKAPGNVAQVVLWAVAGMSWDDAARLAGNRVNAQELALARQLVDRLDAPAAGDTGRLLVEVVAKDDAEPAAAAVRGLFAGRTMLGLEVGLGVPTKPSGPAVACKVQLQGTREKPEALVQVASTDPTGTKWAPVGKFTLPVAVDEAGHVKADAFGDALAEELLKRLVKVVVVRNSANNGGLFAKTPKEQARTAYTVRIENYSPLMLNGIALMGVGAKDTEPLRVLAGIALSPRRSLALPVSADAADTFGLKAGAKVLALDLSGL